MDKCYMPKTKSSWALFWSESPAGHKASNRFSLFFFFFATHISQNAVTPHCYQIRPLRSRRKVVCLLMQSLLTKEAGKKKGTKGGKEKKRKEKKEKKTATDINIRLWFPSEHFKGFLRPKYISIKEETFLVTNQFSSSGVCKSTSVEEKHMGL